MSWKIGLSGLAAIAWLVSAGSAGAQSTGPTCSDSTLVDVEVHGQHIIGDYVAGIGHDTLGWPPSGSDIGDALSTRRGVAIRGGPGPGFHFDHDPAIAPGASFCTDSQSPGIHG